MTMNRFSIFRAARPVPDAYRSNFRHLYFDIAWHGVLAASAMSFVTVYAARQGTNDFQIGLCNTQPFPASYQIVSAMGFVGGAMNTFHLWRIKTRPNARTRPRVGKALGDLARPRVLRILVDGLIGFALLRLLAAAAILRWE